MPMRPALKSMPDWVPDIPQSSVIGSMASDIERMSYPSAMLTSVHRRITRIWSLLSGDASISSRAEAIVFLSRKGWLRV